MKPQVSSMRDEERIDKVLSVSVLIPTKNRAADLTKTVRSVLSQDTLPSQLIVVDQSAGDESKVAIARLFSEGAGRARSVELLYRQEPSIRSAAAARNRAMELANCDILLFLDDDVVLEPEFVAEIVEVYVNYPNAAGVSGIITNYQRPSLIMAAWFAAFERGPFRDDRQQWYWDADRLANGQAIPVSRFTGALMSFRTRAIGGTRFDDQMVGVSDGEDIDFCVRLGKTALLLMAPRARLAHNHSRSERLADHWIRRRARGNAFLRHKNWKNGFANHCYYFWLNTGYAFMAGAASLRRMSLDPWRALRTGLAEGRSCVKS